VKSSITGKKKYKTTAKTNFLGGNYYGAFLLFL